MTPLIQAILHLLISLLVLGLVYYVVKWVLTSFLAVPVKILQILRIIFCYNRSSNSYKLSTASSRGRSY